MKVLDLYCGAGGAAKGLELSGIATKEEITGIDISPQPRYPYRFIQSDALEYLKARGHEYDLLWASPPCQFYNSLSKVNGRLHGKKYPNLIAATREALKATGKPYVIENVVDARKHLINPVMLCGTFFDLKVYRHRLFECYPSLTHLQPHHVPHHDHSPGCRGNRTSPKGYITVCGGKGGGFRLEPASRAMGIDWMTRQELALAIPPAYTRWIGRHMIELIQSLQPTEADAGKEVYVDAVTKRGIFKGGIHERNIKGSIVTLGFVKFPDTSSVSIFPVKEIELIPQENTTGEIMLTEQPVAVGDVLVSRSGKAVGTVTRVMKRFVEIDGVKKLTWEDFHILHYTKQKPIAEASSVQSEITEAPVTEVAGISDHDEVEKLVHKINELDRNYIFEVGGCLLRLKEVWHPSEKCPDFDGFCITKLGKRYSSTHRNDLINAAKLQPILSETATAVLSNSLNATKPLYSMMHKGLGSEKIAEVVEEAAATGNVTREAVEAIAVSKGYLAPKRQGKKSAESAVQEQGRSLGLSGSGSQQLPSIESNADIPLAITKPLAECVTVSEIIDSVAANPKSAWDEFTVLNWQERFRLRNLCPDLSTRFRTLESDQMSVGAILTYLELADRDSKIEWLEARVKELESRLQKPVSTRTDEWYTPPEFIEMARQVMGSIDLDPASNELAQEWIKAKKYFTKEDEGLIITSWWKEGDAPINVWCNPPYGRTVELWLETVIDGFLDENIKSAIVLLNRTGAAWYKARTKEVTAICEVYKRIAFIDENGQRQSSPRYYNDFLYLGKDVDKFRQVFSAIGDVRVMESQQSRAA